MKTLILIILLTITSFSEITFAQNKKPEGILYCIVEGKIITRQYPYAEGWDDCVSKYLNDPNFIANQRIEVSNLGGIAHSPRSEKPVLATPFWLAVYQRDKPYLTATFLKHHNLNPNIPANYSHGYPIFWADDEELSYLAKDKRVDLNVRSLNKYTIFSRDDADLHLLHFSYDYDATVPKILLNSPKIDVNPRTKNGNTPVMMQVVCRDEEDCDDISPRKMKKTRDILIADTRTDLNAQNSDGDTVLHLASRYLDFDLIKSLFESGRINSNIHNKKGELATCNIGLGVSNLIKQSPNAYKYAIQNILNLTVENLEERANEIEEFLSDHGVLPCGDTSESENSDSDYARINVYDIHSKSIVVSFDSTTASNRLQLDGQIKGILKKVEAKQGTYMVSTETFAGKKNTFRIVHN